MSEKFAFNLNTKCLLLPPIFSLQSFTQTSFPRAPPGTDCLHLTLCYVQRSVQKYLLDICSLQSCNPRETGIGFICLHTVGCNSEEVRRQYTNCKGGHVEAAAIPGILELQAINTNSRFVSMKAIIHPLEKQVYLSRYYGLKKTIYF